MIVMANNEKRKVFGLGRFEVNLLIIIVMGLLMYDFELNSNFVALGNDDKACDFRYSNPSFSVAFLYLVYIIGA